MSLDNMYLDHACMSKTDDKIKIKGNTGSYRPYAAPLIVCFKMQSSLGIAVLGCTAELSICQSFLETQSTDIRRAWNGQGIVRRQAK